MSTGIRKEKVETNAKDRLASIAVKLAAAWFYGLSMSRLILHGRDLPSEGLAQPAMILGVIILLAVLTWGRYNLLATAGILGLSALGLFVSHDAWYRPAVFARIFDRISAWFFWAFDWLMGYVPGTRTQLELMALLLCLAIAACSYLLVARFNATLLMAAALVTVMLVLRQSSNQSFYFWAALGAIVVIAGIARRQGKLYRYLRHPRSSAQSRLMLQSVPISLLAIFLAAVLTLMIPVNLIHSRGLEGFLDDISSIITGTSWNEPVLPGFSLQSTGFYPLVDRLGGPAFLSDQPVLRIKGSADALLLKGSVSQTYDGNSWRQDPDQSFYRYDSPLWQKEQRQIYDLDLPDLGKARLSNDQVFRMVHFSWSTIGQSTRIIFLSGRPSAVGLRSNDPFQAYFRPSSQLFSKYWLTPAQTVDLSARVLKSEQPEFETMVRQIQSGLSEQESVIPEDIRSRYLQLPDLDPYAAGGVLNELLGHLLKDETDPYRRVLLIRKYLMAVATYNLVVSIPPPDVDFVVWFLQTREGYCVYFATAMTMLCRLAGIPARYVEGYYAAPAAEAGEERILTGENAHAWTEVYLAGIGWVPVDATPGAAVTQPDVLSNVSPTPGAILTPTAIPTPTPTISLAPTPAVTPGEGGRPGLPGMIWRSPWWLVLLIMMLLMIPLLLTTARLKQIKNSHDDVEMARTIPDTRSRTLFFWHELRLLLALLGSSIRVGETPGQFLLRLLKTDSWLSGRSESVQAARSALEQALFSQDHPTEDEVRSLAGLYLVLEKTLQQNNGKIRYWLKRVILHPPALSRAIAYEI